VSVTPTRRLRRLVRRAARHPTLEPLAWRIRAWRRGRTVPPPRAKVADRRARIAVAPGIRAVESQLEELAAAGGPIVAGPWYGSMETELLYWIPFLRWFSRQFGVDRSRITAVSRPGADSWYSDVCGSYAVTTDEVAGRPLPPTLLEAVCGEYWHERSPLVHVLDRLVYARIPTLSLAVPRQAVVFWPAEDGVATLFEPGAGPVSMLEPEERSGAAALTAAVAGARLLVGPWNGRLVLGPMLGVPTVALTDVSSASPHLDLAHRAARILESQLLVVDRDQIELVARLAKRVAG
jgi:hypothetical protein